MECKMCGKVFTPYKMYDLPSGLKVDAYVCKGCLILEILKWNIANPDDIRTWQHGKNDIIVDGEVR